MADSTAPRRSSLYGAWVLAAALIGLAGYVGYVVYPRFDLPAGAGAGLLVLAAAAGVASFFSPCSFPLLVTMLAKPLAETDGRPIRRALAYASALSIGAVGFLTITGGAFALGAGAIVDDVTFTSTTGRVLRITVGAGLVAFGLIQLNYIRVDLRHFEPRLHGVLRKQAELRRRRPLSGFVLFGFVYLLAGFG